MIEIVYKEEEKDLDKKKALKLPKNVQQIGNIKDYQKVYIEDRVIQYLMEKPYSESALKYGVLLGEIKRGNGHAYIFVQGFVQVKSSGEDKICFNEMVWSDIYEQMRQYYPTKEVIGWFSFQYCQGELDELTVRKIHLDHFAGNDKIYLQIIEDEQEEKIYTYNNGTMQERGGYYVYFEKHQDTIDYIDEISYLSSYEEKQQQQQKSYGSFRTTLRELQAGKENKKPFALVHAASSFLVVILLVAVIATMKNYGEMTNIRQSIEELAQKVTRQNSKETDQWVEAEVKEVQGNVTKKPDGKEQDKSTQKDKTTQKSETEKTSSRQEESTINEEKTTSSQETKETVKETEVQTTDSTAEQTTTEATVPANQDEKVYIVQAGETLGAISTKIYHTIGMVEEIKERNGIEDGDKIYEGQKLYLP